MLRAGALKQLTTDHSLVAELVQSGVLTPEEAERHPQRSAITRALGTEETVDVDAFTIVAEPGDLFLICSDGLSTMLSDDDVASSIEESDGDPARAAEALVAKANARGGEDNVTVVLFELVAEPTGRPVAPAAEEHEEPAPERDQGPDTEEHLDPALSEPEPEPEASPRRHGAGPGGRVAALILIAAVLLVGVLGLYLALKR